MKYVKLLCYKCGWYTFDFKPDEKYSSWYPYKDSGQCMGCGYVVKAVTNIHVTDPLEFDEGEG